MRKRFGQMAGTLITAAMLAGGVTSCDRARTPQVLEAPAGVTALAGTEAGRAELVRELDAIFGEERFSHAHWGVRVEKMDGTALYDRSGGKGFVPASTLKMFTTAAALSLLGPDYIYETRVQALGAIEDGVLKGDLLVIGSGDPSLGAWHPDASQNSKQLLEGWVEEVRAAGIHEIEGNIIGDGRYFTEEYIHSSWVYWDLPYWYAAGSSGLAMEENCFRTTIRPGENVGDPAIIDWNPRTGYISIINNVKTVEAGGTSNADIVWRNEENLFVYDRTIAIDREVINERGSIWDGARYAAFLFKEMLEAQGIPVRGEALNIRQLPDPESVDRATPRHDITSAFSPPLSETSKVINRVSQNFFADQVFRTLGREFKGEGSWTAGTEAVRDWLAEIGVPEPEHYIQRDGSGLARSNFFQPRQLTHVLRYMRTDGGAAGEAFYESLSRGGQSSMLERRLGDVAVDHNVRVKTGFIGFTRALAGYCTNADGEELAFVMMVNHSNLGTRAADDLQDAAITLLTKYSEK